MGIGYENTSNGVPGAPGLPPARTRTHGDEIAVTTGRRTNWRRVRHDQDKSCCFSGRSRTPQTVGILFRGLLSASIEE